jgi:hypothetical protein
MKNAGVGVFCCFGFSVFLGSSLALAEPSAVPAASNRAAAASTNDGLENLFYEFDDDALNALGNDAQGMVLRVRPQAAWVVLLRPRVQFVSELLQSVEAL